MKKAAFVPFLASFSTACILTTSVSDIPPRLIQPSDAAAVAAPMEKNNDVPVGLPKLACRTESDLVHIELTGNLSTYRYGQNLPRHGKIWLCLVTKRDNWAILPQQCRAYAHDPEAVYSFDPMRPLEKGPDLFAFRFVYLSVEHHMGDVNLFSTTGACRLWHDEPSGTVSFQLLKTKEEKRPNRQKTTSAPKNFSARERGQSR